MKPSGLKKTLAAFLFWGDYELKNRKRSRRAMLVTSPAAANRRIG
jgi:hypothetical protein